MCAAAILSDVAAKIEALAPEEFAEVSRRCKCALATVSRKVSHVECVSLSAQSAEGRTDVEEGVQSTQGWLEEVRAHPTT